MTATGEPPPQSTQPLTGIRKAIAANLITSLQTTAQVTSFYEVEAQPLMVTRAASADQQVPVGYDAVLAWACARALRAVPVVNARIVDGDIVYPAEVNVGVAVALDESFGVGGGLIVPVIYNADTKSIPEIAAELAEKVERARSRRLGPTDVQRGTFTISNLGGLPGAAYWRGATPIINGSQGAILAVGRIRDAAVVVGGAVTVRPVVPLSLTHDHRLIDGAPAGAFIEQIMLELAAAKVSPTLHGAP